MDTAKIYAWVLLFLFYWLVMTERTVSLLVDMFGSIPEKNAPIWEVLGFVIMIVFVTLSWLGVTIWFARFDEETDESKTENEEDNDVEDEVETSTE